MSAGTFGRPVLTAPLGHNTPPPRVDLQLTPDRQRIARARELAVDQILTPETPLHRMRAPLYTDAELEALPAPSWLLEQHLPAGGLSVLYGDPGSGKSFVALAWALSIATGKNWLNWQTRAGPVIYVAAEGGRGFAVRVRALMDAHELVSPTGAYFRLQSVNLMDPNDVSDLLADVAFTVAGDPSLFVFDTMARCMIGDENSAEDIGKVIASCDRIREATNAHVLIQHHTQKAGELERGSSALRGAADTMFLLKQDDGILNLTCTKQKDGLAVTPQRLRLQAAGDSCVVEPLETSLHSQKLTANEQQALVALSQVAMDDGASSGEWQTTTNLVGGSYFRARKRLVDLGYVTTKGRPKRYVLTGTGLNAVLPATNELP